MKFATTRVDGNGKPHQLRKLKDFGVKVNSKWRLARACRQIVKANNYLSNARGEAVLEGIAVIADGYAFGSKGACLCAAQSSGFSSAAGDFGPVAGID